MVLCLVIAENFCLNSFFLMLNFILICQNFIHGSITLKFDLASSKLLCHLLVLFYGIVVRFHYILYLNDYLLNLIL